MRNQVVEPITIEEPQLDRSMGLSKALDSILILDRLILDRYSMPYPIVILIQ